MPEDSRRITLCLVTGENEPIRARVLHSTRDGRYQLFLSIRYLLDILLFLPISIFSIQSSIYPLK